MKIVHINTFDSRGGAAISTFRLHQAMLKSGIDSSMFVLNQTKKSNDKIYSISKLQSRFIKPLVTEIGKLLMKFRHNYPNDLFAYPFGRTNISNYSSVKEADIIYLHWINEFLHLKDLKSILKLGKPVYWFMHDMWPMTGGCFHSFNCEGYLHSCGNCPLLPRASSKDLSYQFLNKKIKYLQQFNNLHIIAPSMWLTGCVKKSRIFQNNRVFTIPNSIDIELYKTVCKDFSREVFNLPKEKKIILFGANFAMTNPFKGWTYLQDSLNKLAINHPDWAVFVFGADYDASIAGQIPFPSYFSGKLSDNYSLILLYNAADVFVAPSLADNFPNTIVESLACETPVVGFDIGGIPDLILHKENGYLAKYKDSDDLAAGIQWVLANAISLKESGRGHIINLCSESIIIQKHLDLYKNNA